MKLNIKALGLSLGILWALALLILSLIAIATGMWHDTLAVLGEFYIGYDLSAVGIVIGLVYAFLDAFIGGVLLAWLYNKLS